MSHEHDICRTWHIQVREREGRIFSTRSHLPLVCGWVVFVCNISSKQMDLMIALEWYVDACSTVCKSNAIEVGCQDWQWQTKLNSQFTRSLTACDAADICPEFNGSRRSTMQICECQTHTDTRTQTRTHTTRHVMAFDCIETIHHPYCHTVAGSRSLVESASSDIEYRSILISVNQM